MEVKIFNGLSIEERLSQIEENAGCYDLSEIDMNNKDDRAFVKGEASDVKKLIDKVNRKRIDVKKEYGNKVESEAKWIIDRLSGAASEFTNLIDAYNAERKVILDAEKARKQAILDAEQKELDHETAILEDKARTLDKIEQERLQKERDEQLLKQAEEDKRIALKLAEKQRLADIEQAKQDEINRQEAEKAKLEAERKAREADIEYRKEVNNNIVNALINETGIALEQAQSVVKAAVKNKLPKLTINY